LKKAVVPKYGIKVYGRVIYSGIYKLSENGVSGNSWFIKESG